MVQKINNFEYIENVLKRSIVIIDEYNVFLNNNNEYGHTTIISDLEKSKYKLNFIKEKEILLSLILSSVSTLFKNKNVSITFYIKEFNDEIYFPIIKECIDNIQNVSFSISNGNHYFNGNFYKIDLNLE